MHMQAENHNLLFATFYRHYEATNAASSFDCLGKPFGKYYTHTGECFDAPTNGFWHCWSV
jgi:hypothetical protein